MNANLVRLGCMGVGDQMCVAVFGVLRVHP